MDTKYTSTRNRETPLKRRAGVFVAALLLVFYLPTVWGGFVPHGSLGCTFGPHDEVESVARDGPAARAGLRAGDVLAANAHDWAIGFAAVTGDLAPNVPFDLRVTNNGRTRTVHIVSATAPPAPLSDALFEVGAYLATATALIVAGALCLLRPGAMSWWLVLYAAGTVSANQLIFAYGFLPTPLREALVAIVLALIGSTAAMPILPFVLRFPYDDVTGRRAIVYRVSVFATIAVGVGFLACYAVLAAAHGFDGRPLYAEASVIATIACDIPIPLAIVVLFSTYLRADPQDRARLRWGIFGMSFSFAAYAASANTTLSNSVVGNALQLLTVMLPISLAYAMKRHGLIDVNFIVNRTIAYGATTLVVLLIVQLVHEAMGWILQKIALPPLFALVVTMVAGIYIARFHNLLGTLVERVFFRKRLAAEVRLRLVAGAMLYAQSARAVDDMLAVETAMTLRLTSAAVFHFEPSHYVRTATVGWDDGQATIVEHDDVLALMLSSEQGMIKLSDVTWKRSDLPVGAEKPALAFPLSFHREMLGFVVFGAHTNGTSIDPDEVQLLQLLADNAGTAYGLVRGNEARLRLEALEAARVVTMV